MCAAHTSKYEITQVQMSLIVLATYLSAVASFNCPSCDLVPCGQCQEGCLISFNGCPNPLPNHPGANSRNGCKAGNKGEHPTGCSKPDPDAPLRPLPHGSSFCGESGWRQVWTDEFNGNTLDNSTWSTDLVSSIDLSSVLLPI